jgi:chemotaxis protein CheX
VSDIKTDIEDIFASIWSSLFDLGLSPSDEGHTGTGPLVSGCVQIVGPWRGAVMLQCPLPLARTLAEQMFGAQSAPTLDEVRDAIGELTNMFGGNVKALLPGPSRISLPVVAVGSDYDLGLVDTRAMTAVAFQCDGQRLLATLLEGAGDSVAASL